MKARILKLLKFLVFFGLGLFLIWWFQRKLSLLEKDQIIQAFYHVNYWWVGLSVVLGVLSHYVRAIRWKMMMEPMGYKPKTKTTFMAVMIGYLANLAFPRLGEVMRCGILNKYENVPINKSFGTVVTERVFDMIIFASLFFIVLFFEFARLKDYVYNEFWLGFANKFNNINFTGFMMIVAMSVIALITVLGLVFRKKIIHSGIYSSIRVIVIGFLEGLKSLIHIKRPFLFIIYSLLIWLLYFLMLYVIFFSIEESASLGILCGMAALVMGSVGIIVIPGGIGIYPLIISQTLVFYGLSKTTGYALGWVAWTSQTLTIMLLGLISFVILPIIKRKEDAKA